MRKVGILFSLALLTLGTGWAQKIEVGTYVFKKDGAVYTGDLYNGKPNGVGRTVEIPAQAAARY